MPLVEIREFNVSNRFFDQPLKKNKNKKRTKNLSKYQETMTIQHETYQINFTIKSIVSFLL